MSAQFTRLRSSQKQLTLLLLLAGSELAVYTFEAVTRGVEVHTDAGNGEGGGDGVGGGGVGGGVGVGVGDSTTGASAGGGGGRPTHRTADASSVSHRSGLVAWFLHMRSWPSHPPQSARWPYSSQFTRLRSSQKQLTLLLLLAGSELAVYTFEALTSGVEVHTDAGGGNGGGGGDGDGGVGDGGGGDGDGDSTTGASVGGGGGRSTHRTADASS